VVYDIDEFVEIALVVLIEPGVEGRYDGIYPAC
jgi:hypothetical protein